MIDLSPRIRACVTRATIRTTPFPNPNPIRDGEQIVVNLAGMRLQGAKAVQAGAIFRVGAIAADRWREARPVEWWAVIGEGTTAKNAIWYVARIGVGDVAPWDVIAVGDRVRYRHPSWGPVVGRVLLVDGNPGHVLVQDLTPDVGAREWWPTADLQLDAP